MEVVAAPVGIDRDVGADAARVRLDREGPPAGHAVELEALRVARDDRPDGFALAEFDGGHMRQAHPQAIDLALLIGRDPNALIVRSGARDVFREGRKRAEAQDDGDGGGKSLHPSSPYDPSGWNIR